MVLMLIFGNRVCQSLRPGKSKVESISSRSFSLFASISIMPQSKNMRADKGSWIVSKTFFVEDCAIDYPYTGERLRRSVGAMQSRRYLLHSVLCALLRITLAGFPTATENS